MPKGKKVCPKCNLEHGVRTQSCECGHVFKVASMAVPAGKHLIENSVAATSAVDSVHEIAKNVESLREIIDNVDTRRTEERVFQAAPVVNGIVRQQRTYNGDGGKIATPVGDCPVRPQGYKDKWPDGTASDKVVQDWAKAVYNSSEGRYAVEAVVYFARYFWNINSEDYQRVRELIVRTLRPTRLSVPEVVDV